MAYYHHFFKYGGRWKPPLLCRISIFSLFNFFKGLQKILLHMNYGYYFSGANCWKNFVFRLVFKPSSYLLQIPVASSLVSTKSNWIISHNVFTRNPEIRNVCTKATISRKANNSTVHIFSLNWNHHWEENEKGLLHSLVWEVFSFFSKRAMILKIGITETKNP